LLRFFKGTSCIDPRDRIYALQNMASGPSILVDYTMDSVDLYWEVLWRCDTYDTELPDTERNSWGSRFWLCGPEQCK
jgi:hypothetical protein